MGLADKDSASKNTFRASILTRLSDLFYRRGERLKLVAGLLATIDTTNDLHCFRKGFAFWIYAANSNR